MIPYVDLKAQHRRIQHEIEDAVTRVLRSGQYILGEEVSAFEQEFAAYCRTSLCVAASSGTSALHLALLAAGIGPGHEVITTPFTFIATVAAICYTGARPVFVDIDPVHFTIDPTLIEAAITPRTRAIVPVHLYGQPADMAPILHLARARGLAVIEDAAQAHGAEYHGRRCGSMGEIAAFSFYPAKNLGACGEGGAVVTADSAVAKTCRLLRDWGQETRYEHHLKGFNYRMDAIQGTILRVKLRHLETWIIRRQEIARRYDELLADGPFRVPAVRPECRHVYQVYVVRSSERDRCRDLLAKQGIHTGLHYSIPAHLQPAYADLGHHVGDFPHAEAAAAEVMSLPLFPEMTDDQVETVAAALLEGVSA